MEISLYFHQMEKPITMSFIVRIYLLFSLLIFQSTYSQKEFQGGIKFGFSINESVVKGYETENFLVSCKTKRGKTISFNLSEDTSLFELATGTYKLQITSEKLQKLRTQKQNGWRKKPNMPICFLILIVRLKEVLWMR
jgi:hypothetical protein